MNIKLFGITKTIIGDSSLFISTSVQRSSRISDVSSLKTYLIDCYPELEDLRSLAVAVNNSYATGDTKIGEEDEIALIPPVSGG